MQQAEEKSIMFSALEVSNICGVVNQTAINWIRNGYLKASKTPGGQYRVYPDDLAEFMQSRNLEIPEELAVVCKSPKFLRNSLLIVDDDKGLNTVIAKYMERKFSNMDIYQAFDGFEAGSIMSDKNPGCLLLDLNLPGIDGIDLCKRINENEKYGNPSIIVVTSLENPEVEKQAMELGVKCYMKKPLDLLKLSEMVASIFGN
ncbi:MAG: response regulator [Treponema sp.]|nr:response regulator [Candidatus Treponema equifaecale]